MNPALVACMIGSIAAGLTAAALVAASGGGWLLAALAYCGIGALALVGSAVGLALVATLAPRRRATPAPPACAVLTARIG